MDEEAPRNQAGRTSMNNATVDHAYDDNPKHAVAIEVNHVSVQKSASPLWRRILSFIWDSADGDEEYRRYVRRLDLGLLCVDIFEGQSRASRLIVIPSVVL